MTINLSTTNYESESIEYKLADKEIPANLWETISAFSNADGGTIILGAKDDGTRKGVDLKNIDKFQKDIISLCINGFNHKLYPSINVLKKDNIIEVYIPPSSASERPIYSESRGLPRGARVRIGSVNSQVDDEWIRRFALAASGGAELQMFDGDYKKNFNFDLLNQYLNSVRSKRGNIYLNLDPEEILIKMRAINNELAMTLFGLLALSNEDTLQNLTAPTVNIAVTQYSGTEKVNPTDIAEVSLDDKKFFGNVVQQFEESLKFLLTKLPTKGKIEIKTGKRRDYLAVPEIAIREILANAIVHRDYSTYRSRIQIDIYKDRIEFVNPGCSLIPLEQIEKSHSETRNPLLMNFLRDLSITEQRGRGIPTIKASLKKAGLPYPKFEHRNDQFVAVIYSEAFIKDDDQIWLQQFLTFKLNERQHNALVHLRHSEEGINNSEYRDINNMLGVGDDLRARRELSALVNKKLTNTTGANRNRRYVLNNDS